MTSFAFTKMIVDDLEREVLFYEQVIGLRVVMRLSNDASEADQASLSSDGTQAGGTSLTLLQYRNKPAPVPGELMLGFMVEDAEKVAQSAVTAGGTIIEAPYDELDHGLRIGVIADPEGHAVQIIQLLVSQ